MATLVSVPLLVAGVLSVVLAYIYLRHEEKSKLTLSIFWLGLSCGVWCLAYAIMGLSPLERAPIHRLIGSVAVHGYLLAFCFFFLLAAKLRVPAAVKRNWIIFLVIFTAIDTVAYGQMKNVTFSMINGRVCYFPNQTPERYLHYLWITVCVIYLYITGAFWWRKARYERERRLILSMLASGVLMLACACFDTFLERLSIPTSGYGAFVAYVIITSISMKQNAFSISVQNLGEYIFRSAGMPVLILDDNGRIKLSNDSAQKYIGVYGVGDELTAFFDIPVSEYAALFERGRGATERQITAVARSGLRTCRFDFTVVCDPYGDPYCTICFINDITHEEQMIEELRQAKDEKQKESEALIIARDAAETANRSKTTFLANMSHEIRTPLNSVLGMDEMILRESREDATLVYATNIQSAGRTLLSLINDILDFSKIESGKLEIVPVNYQLSSLINDTVNMIRPRAVAKGLELRVEADPQLPGTLFGDEVRIRQIIMNLMTNAVKYTDSGSVTFKLDFERINSQDAGLYVNFELIALRISVRDTGHGIRREDIDKLFDSFERVELKRNRNIEGTGLGLAITRQLVGLMNGRIDVQSEFGKGSNFTVTIPQKVTDKKPIGDLAARLERQPVSENGSYRASFTAPDAKVLVVDDNEMNLMVVQGLLEPTGVRVETAQSGARAVELAEENRYDLVLLDHMMPEMDGVEALRRMRLEGLSKDAPVIALTANAVSGSREMYLKLGFNDYLSKPIAGSTLEKKLAQWLPAELVQAQESLAPEESPVAAASAGTEQDGGALPEEISLEKALNFTANGVAGVYSNCRLYLDNAAAVRKNLTESFEKKDYKDYGIYAHSLKSTSAIIGAESMSDLAKKMEFAAKEGDFTYIETHHDELMAHYADFTDRLASACAEPETAAGGMSDDEATAQIAKNLHRLQLAAETYDTVSVAERIDTLADIPYDDPDFRTLLTDLRSAVAAFDYDRVVSIAEQNIDNYF